MVWKARPLRSCQLLEHQTAFARWYSSTGLQTLEGNINHQPRERCCRKRLAVAPCLATCNLPVSGPAARRLPGIRREIQNPKYGLPYIVTLVTMSQ